MVVPLLRRYYRGAKTSRCPSRRASSPSLGDTISACIPLFAPVPLRMLRRSGLGLVSRFPFRLLRHGDSEISQVPGPPSLGVCSALGPRPDRRTRPSRCGRCCPRCCDDEGSDSYSAFEARSQGFRDRCLRFAAGIAPAQRKTRFGLRTSLYRTGLATRRATTEGFQQILAHLPPPPGFAWRDTTFDHIPNGARVCRWICSNSSRRE